jgi:uncharacterized protein (DUF1800 family)
MAPDREWEPFVASRRFGLGARPGEIASYRGDARGAVLAQLDPWAGLLTGPDLPTSAEAIRRYWSYADETKKQRESGAAKPDPAPRPSAAGMAVGGVMGEAAPPGGGGAPRPNAPAAPIPAPVSVHEQLHRIECEVRLERQLSTAHPMVERLVNFWSNHFCVAGRKSAMIKAVAGAYEREVVRPHVLGRFADMLSASAHHPAMLAYLDNNVSIGPTSKAGLRSRKIGRAHV